jgi:hypothetical protein
MIEFNTLYWDNVPKEFVDAHIDVMDHFGIPMQYFALNADHGQWMDAVMINAKSDSIIGFFDIDCVPLAKEKIEKCIDYVIKNDTMLGCAQVSNHFHPATHVFAAPSFLIISKNFWEKLGRPSFTSGEHWDVAEAVSYIVENEGQPYRCLYPDCFEKASYEGVWKLGNYGFFGIGTVFDDTVYHLFQGRTNINSDLFIRRCHEIISGTFSTQDFTKSKTGIFDL